MSRRKREDDVDEMKDDEKAQYDDMENDRPVQQMRMREPERPIVFTDQVWTLNQYDTICLDPSNALQPECTMKQQIVAQSCPADENDPITQETMNEIAPNDRIEWYARDKGYPDTSKFPRTKKCLNGTGLSEYVARGNKKDPLYTYDMSAEQLKSIKAFESSRAKDEVKEREVKEQQSDFERKQIAQQGVEAVQMFGGDMEDITEEWTNEYYTLFKEIMQKKARNEWNEEQVEEQLDKLYKIYSPKGEQILLDLQQEEREKIKQVMALSDLNDVEKNKLIRILFSEYGIKKHNLTRASLKPIAVDNMIDLLSDTYDVELLREFNNSKRWNAVTFDFIKEVIQSPSYRSRNVNKTLFLTYMFTPQNQDGVGVPEKYIKEWVARLLEPSTLDWLVQHGMNRQWILDDIVRVAESIDTFSMLKVLLDRQLLTRDDLHRTFMYETGFGDELQTILTVYTINHTFESTAKEIQLTKEDLLRNDHFLLKFAVGRFGSGDVDYTLKLADVRHNSDLKTLLVPIILRRLEDNIMFSMNRWYRLPDTRYKRRALREYSQNFIKRIDTFRKHGIGLQSFWDAEKGENEFWLLFVSWKRDGTYKVKYPFTDIILHVINHEALRPWDVEWINSYMLPVQPVSAKRQFALALKHARIIAE